MQRLVRPAELLEVPLDDIDPFERRFMRLVVRDDADMSTTTTYGTRSVKGLHD